MYTSLLIANSGNYLHLSIVVHYKKVCNNNLLRVNFNFNSNYYICHLIGTIKPSVHLP